MKILRTNEFIHYDDKRKINESHDNLLSNESDFGKYLRTNTPMIYAFMTTDIPDAIKVGYTNQGVTNRIAQWMQKYNNITVLGQWTAYEFNQINERVFFMDHPVHSKIEKRGYANLKPTDTRFSSIENIHVSKEFFNKYKGIDKDEADVLSEQIIEDIIDELKNDIRNNTAKINLYKFINKTTIQNAGKVMENPNTFSPTPLQQQCIDNAKQAVKDGKTDMLMAAVMRFGKTAATYWIIKECNFKYVVVTSAKADTRTAWRNDINHKDFIDDFCFIEFDGKYNLLVSEKDDASGRIVTESYQDEDLIKNKIKSGKTVVIYATLQDLSGKHEAVSSTLGIENVVPLRKIKDKHRYIFDNQPDMLVIDETHYGSHSGVYGKSTGLDNVDNYMDNSDVKTEIKKESREIGKMDNYTKNINARYRLQCSGTPYYILASGEFAEKYAQKTIISDVSQSDMIESRDRWIEENPDKDESESPYFGIPNVYKFGMRLTKECKRALTKSDESASMHVLFKNDGKKFAHKKAVKSLMESIFGANNKDMPGWLNEKKIKNGEIFKHMVMVLPHINDCHLMKKMLINENFVNEKEREIIVAVERRTSISDGYLKLEEDAKDSDTLNAKLEKLENEGKHSLVITVNRFLTGVSVPLWDSMLYMKDTKSPQEYDQNVMRLCTRCIGKAKDTVTGEEVKLCKKQNVYVIDFKIDRMFDMVIQSVESQMIASGKAWTSSEMKKKLKQSLRTTPIYSVEKDSTYDDKSDEIVAGMHELSTEDLLKKYINYNKAKSIEDTIDINDFSRFTKNADNIDCLKGFSMGNLNAVKKIMNQQGEDEINISTNNDARQTNILAKKTKKEEKGYMVENAMRLMNMIKSIMYSALCMSINKSIDSISTYLDAIRNDKECKKIANEFNLNEKKINEVLRRMDVSERSRIEMYLSNLNLIMNDSTMSPLERAQTSIMKLGKLDKNEVITPKILVDKMISKLDENDIKNADSILEVNSKTCEFLVGIHEKYGKEIAKKVKVVASSSMSKHFIKMILKILELDENNLIEINDTENYNIKDFLDTDMTKENKGKKFDICLMNPPFDKSLHLDFLEKSIELCNKTVIIEPGQWLVQLKENGKYTKENSKSKKIQNKIEGHVKSVELNNYNKELNIANKTVCSIIYVDFTKKYNEIDFECITEKSKVKFLSDCNLIGEKKIVDDILNKCKSYKDHMIDHVINLKKYKEYEDKGYWFLPYGNYMINNLGTMQTHKWTSAFHTKNDFIDTLNSYFEVLCTKHKEKLNNKVYIGTKSNNPVDSVYGTKEQMENWYYFVYNNKLPLFINICLTIDENNNSREYVPWLVDKKYTDEEIYKKLNITKEEQKLIDKTIKNFDKDTTFGRKLFGVE